MTARYAVYFTPADGTALARFGAIVLGREVTTHKERRNPDAAIAAHSDTGSGVKTTTGRNEDIVPFADASLWRRYTEKPAHYGFHATIKAPFELAADCTAAELLSELSSFCANQPAIALTDLAPTSLQAFTALTLPTQPNELIELAADVVKHFEPYRQELTSADRQRRQIATLSPSQLDNLEHYGYPYIFDDFQFHMTLSDALPPDEDRFLPWVRSIYQQMVLQTPLLDRLCVFRQVDRTTPFVRIAEFRLSDTA